MLCFLRFDFETCFAPQHCAPFPHLNFQKCPETALFFAILPSKCASRHSGVQFLISHLPRWLRTAFTSLLFDPQGHKVWKNTVFRDFLKPYHVGWSFSPLTLSHLRSSFFFLSRLWLFSPPPFPSVHIDHIVGSLTSKLPSIIQHAYPFWVGNLLQLRQSLPRQWAQGWRPWGDGWTCSGHDWQRPKPSPFELVPDLQYFVVGSVT